jgi:hypothetical protein
MFLPCWSREQCSASRLETRIGLRDTYVPSLLKQRTMFCFSFRDSYWPQGHLCSFLVEKENNVLFLVLRLVLTFLPGWSREQRSTSRLEIRSYPWDTYVPSWLKQRTTFYFSFRDTVVPLGHLCSFLSSTVAEVPLERVQCLGGPGAVFF